MYMSGLNCCLLHVLLQGHGVLGLQVVLDDVALTLHAARTQRAVEDPRLYLTAPVLALRMRNKYKECRPHRRKR